MMYNDDLQEKGKNSEADNKPEIQPDTPLKESDPQESMEGPISSLIHKSSKIMESDISKEEAQKKHDERW